MSVQILEQRLWEYFAAFARGDDVAPARRFFLEGYLQAVLDSGVVTEQELRQRLAASCEASLGEAAARVYREAKGPLELHSHMHRAPVYPTTSQ